MEILRIDAHKDKLISDLMSGKGKLSKLVAKLNKPKKVKLLLDLEGRYAIRGGRTLLVPRGQGSIEREYYDYTLKIDEEEYKKRTYASRIADKLLKGICATIERTSWYC